MRTKIPLDIQSQKILTAIENPKFKARTLRGVAKETGIKLSDVKLKVESGELKNRVMRLPGLKKNNKDLYATVDRYKKLTPVSVRIMNMITKG